MGDLADTVSTEVLLATNNRGGAQPYLCDLQGKRLVWASETDLNARLNAAQIKLITGGGTIKTRPLYGNMIEFQPSHLVMLITNFKPKANADDDALWNRMVLLPFDLRFVATPSAPDERQRDAHLINKLAQERSGILAWLVRGCLDWQQQGLAIPDAIKASTDAYREEEDMIGQFIDDCCIIRSNIL
jgi:putative DNA primase/helicase